MPPLWKEDWVVFSSFHDKHSLLSGALKVFVFSKQYKSTTPAEPIAATSGGLLEEPHSFSFLAFLPAGGLPCRGNISSSGGRRLTAAEIEIPPFWIINIHFPHKKKGKKKRRSRRGPRHPRVRPTDAALGLSPSQSQQQETSCALTRPDTGRKMRRLHARVTFRS